MNDKSTLINALTWNIHSCIGLDCRHNIERTGRQLRRISPDIAALQEVDLRRKSRTQGNEFNYLCGHIGNYTHEAWALTEKNGNYGQLLISRYPIVEKATHDISLAGREPRKVMEAIIELPSGLVRVIATHLGFWPDEKKFQPEKLKEIILGETSLPLILMGDLNDWSGRKINILLEDNFNHYTRHKSFPSLVPILALDRISCRGTAQIIDSSVDRQAYLY
jgi:endonuclease/exonuclease/phosphatase family metal-dependent hydrolase